MREEPSTDGVPGSVSRYLLPDERQVIVLRAHPVSMIAPGLALPGVAGRVLGYGSLTPRSGSRRRMLPRVRLPYPEQLYLELSHAIQAYTASDGDPDDDR